MNVGTMIENVGKTLGVLVLIFGAGIAWQTLQSRSAELEEELEETRGAHERDMERAQATDAKIAEWIEIAEKQRIREDANLRALCASKKLTGGAAYCETRGYPWGID